VLDEDHGDTLGGETPDHGHAALQLARGETRQPLIEQHDARPRGERARQFDALLLDVSELIEPPVGLRQQIELAEHAGRLVTRILKGHPLAGPVQHAGHDGADRRHVRRGAHELEGAVDALAHA